MQIKTYTASSMKDILSQIKSELGKDAVILSKREIADKTFGLTARPLIEVTAAVDFDAGISGYHLKTSGASSGMPEPALQAFSGSSTEHLAEGITELKDMIKELIAHSGMKLHEKNPLRKKLLSRGIRPNLVDVLLTKLGAGAKESAVRSLLGKLVRTEEPAASRVWVFMGTTGVGKTTTIAKIAAGGALNHRRKVGLITLDTYRIGAVDQGRIYAKILNIPFMSVSSVSEFRAALGKMGSLDLVLVDTVGRSALCRDYIPHLREYLDGIDPCTFLLMPVATRDSEMDTVTRTFSGLDIHRMIFTKADEAMHSGSVITHNLIHRIPVSYITTGQRVPEDIEKASSSMIVHRCLGDRI
ncbi:MAG: flagellar biosynthesis protein FlhF [Desulfomonilia bacterium]|nr:flagellar biosynthesis protein FlhF [Deltaproteobacteria bacterium]MDX9761658.1 flagellar biosynthesis protein FlhF [Desulfomonilia bacterium]HPW68048.1 flagellar biosynthesis protein FlhF [Deltaproteobacteria bacterium]